MRTEIYNLICMTRFFDTDDGKVVVLEVYKKGEDLEKEYDNYHGSRSVHYTKLFKTKDFTVDNVVTEMAKKLAKPQSQFQTLVASFDKQILKFLRNSVEQNI